MSQDQIAILVVVALVAAAVLAAAVVALTVRLSRLRRDYATALGTDRREDLFAAVSRQVEDLASLRADIGVVAENTELLRDLLGNGISRVATVRYDAFEDMGGALSFSTALLDERGNGVIFSAINGRTETRTYAKPIAARASEHHLSNEEETAISEAMSGTSKTSSTVAASGRRRRRVG